MAKKNKPKNDKPKPDYYRNRKLTIGMLQDLCSKFKDKASEVLICDRLGQSPTNALRGVVLSEQGKPTELVLCGAFNWNAEEEEQDPTEDTELADPTDWEAAYEGAICSTNHQEPGDCVEMIQGLSYLEHPNTETKSATTASL